MQIEKRSGWNWTRAVVASATSVLLLALVVLQADAAVALAYLGKLDWRYVAIGGVFSLLVLFSRTLRFRALFPGVGFLTLVAIVSTQNLLLRVTPFRLGELSFPILLQRYAGESPARAMVHLVLVRLLEFWMLVCAALLAVAWLLGPSSANGLLGLGFALLVASVLLMTFQFWLRFGAGLLGRVIQRLPRERVPARLRDLMIHVTEVIDDTERLSGRQRLQLGLCSLAVVAFQYAMLAALAGAIGVRFGFWQGIIGISLAQAASALPVSTLGTIGSYEAGWTVGFVMVGVSTDAAVASAIASQLLTLLFAAALAVPSALMLRRMRRTRETRAGGPVGAD